MRESPQSKPGSRKHAVAAAVKGSHSPCLLTVKGSHSNSEGPQSRRSSSSSFAALVPGSFLSDSARALRGKVGQKEILKADLISLASSSSSSFLFRRHFLSHLQLTLPLPTALPLTCNTLTCSCASLPSSTRFCSHPFLLVF